MRWNRYQIQDEIYSVLELSELDEDELREYQGVYKDTPNIELSLSDLQFLGFFPKVEILILTGGIPTKEGVQILYSCNQLKKLVLFYEETDSDEDGIVLSNFRELTYVLSLSNLNIFQLEKQSTATVIEVLNIYRRGKCIQRKYVGCNSPLRIVHAIFFSCEVETPAGYLLIPILKEYGAALEPLMRSGKYSKNLDKIAIIPVCMSERLLSRGFGKERKYVSRKNRYADIRLQIPYDQLLSADWLTRIAMCEDCILRCADYLRSKDSSFCFELFMQDVADVSKKLTQRYDV